MVQSGPMFVVCPESQTARKVSCSKGSMIMSLHVSLKGNFFLDKWVEDFESRPRHEEAQKEAEKQRRQRRNAETDRSCAHEHQSRKVFNKSGMDDSKKRKACRCRTEACTKKQEVQSTQAVRREVRRRRMR